MCVYVCARVYAGACGRVFMRLYIVNVFIYSCTFVSYICVCTHEYERLRKWKVCVDKCMNIVLSLSLSLSLIRFFTLLPPSIYVQQAANSQI